MVSRNRSGTHQKMTRTCCGSRKAVARSAGSGLACMKKNDVLPVRVGRRRNGEREVVCTHKKTSRTICESGKAVARSAGSNLACIKRHHVHSVRVGRQIHGHREVVWHASKDITYSL
jgi:hypothetical protein